MIHIQALNYTKYNFKLIIKWGTIPFRYPLKLHVDITASMVVKYIYTSTLFHVIQAQIQYMETDGILIMCINYNK